MTSSLTWVPLLPLAAGALVAGAIVVVLLARLRRAPETGWRAVPLLLLAFLLLNPLLLHETRQGLPDKVLVVVDESQSQEIGGRSETARQALLRLTGVLDKAGIEPMVIPAARADSQGGQDGTNLFSALRGALPGIPLPQVAGTVFITDGQVHDTPADLGPLQSLGPFSAVLTGTKGETDRKVTVVSAPRYGMLGQDVTIAVKVEEFGRASGAPVALTVAQDGKKQDTVSLAPGETGRFTFRLDHTGQNVFEFSVPEEKGELTALNNTAPVIVSGIRDRLRVLLVSGAPHMGERAWRNLLKSDPSIDLVHFTILRLVSSIDTARSEELSLIVFPVDELFQRKLEDFDLVIFDKYTQTSLLTRYYFSNIASYVKQGGALLLAMGSDGGEDEIFETPLASVLPVTPGREGTLREAYRPVLTDFGKRHPVTAELRKIFDEKPWGRWFTQAQLSKDRGEVLMSGARGLPLLVLDKAGEGRVAVLASDNIWLWSRSAETGGAYARLLRNTAHWLMKEPELEDDYIRAAVKGRTISVARRDLSSAPGNVEMTRPSGEKETVALSSKTDDGWIGADIAARESGIYGFGSGGKKSFVVVGTAASPEFSDVHTTGDKMGPLVNQTGGAVLWFREDPSFDMGDLPLRRRGASVVRSVESRALVPDVLALLLILGAMFFAWWRESNNATI